MTSKKKTTSKKKANTSKKSEGSKETKLSALDKRRTNNKSRVNRIKEATREEIRRKFKAKEYIKQLEQAAKRLEEIIEQLNTATALKAKIPKKDKERLLLLRMQTDLLSMKRDTIKVQIDLNLRRLKYCVPELKAIELSDPDGNNPLAGLSDMFREALSK